MYRETYKHNCCGMEFIMSFGLYTPNAMNELEKYVQQVKDNNADSDEGYNPEEGDRISLIVLTDDQLFEQGWEQPLKEKGWKRLYRWMNSNSGNYCNLMVYGEGEQ